MWIVLKETAKTFLFVSLVTLRKDISGHQETLTVVVNTIAANMIKKKKKKSHYIHQNNTLSFSRRFFVTFDNT